MQKQIQIPIIISYLIIFAHTHTECEDEEIKNEINIKCNLSWEKSKQILFVGNDYYCY